MTHRGWVASTVSFGALVALTGLAAADILLAYRTTPGAGAVLPVVIATLAIVVWRPAAGVYAAILAVPLVVFNVRVGSLAGLSPQEILMVLTAAAALVHFLAGGRARELNQVHTTFIGLLLVTAVGMAFAEHTAATAKILVMWTVFLGVSVLVASFDREQVQRVLLSLAIAGGILGLIAVASQTNQELVAGGEFAANRASASFAHPNLLAFFLVMSIPPGLVLGARAVGAVRGVALGAGVLAVTALLLTLSREGMIGAAVALLVLLAWPAFRRVAVALLAVIIIVAALNATTLYRAREVSVVEKKLNLVAQRLSTLSQPEILKRNPRVTIWRKVPAMFGDYAVVGAGQGNFPIVSPRYGLIDFNGDPFVHPHNVFFTIGIETGVFGLAFLVAFLLAVGRTASRALRAPSGDVDPMVLAVIASLVGLLVVSLTDYPLRANFVTGTVLILVGALVALERNQGRFPEPVAG